jgi:hypothetical protein
VAALEAAFGGSELLGGFVLRPLYPPALAASYARLHGASPDFIANNHARLHVAAAVVAAGEGSHGSHVAALDAVVTIVPEGEGEGGSGAIGDAEAEAELPSAPVRVVEAAPKPTRTAAPSTSVVVEEAAAEWAQEQQLQQQRSGLLYLTPFDVTVHEVAVGPTAQPLTFDAAHLMVSLAYSGIFERARHLSGANAAAAGSSSSSSGGGHVIQQTHTCAAVPVPSAARGFTATVRELVVLHLPTGYCDAGTGAGAASDAVSGAASVSQPSQRVVPVPTFGTLTLEVLLAPGPDTTYTAVSTQPVTVLARGSVDAASLVAVASTSAAGDRGGGSLLVPVFLVDSGGDSNSTSSIGHVMLEVCRNYGRG